MRAALALVIAAMFAGTWVTDTSGAQRTTQVVLTRCVAVSPGGTQATGLMSFAGNCNGRSTYRIVLTASSTGVLGLDGGMRIAFIASGRSLAGRISTWRTSYLLSGRTVLGRYGPYRLHFSVFGDTLVGSVGTARVRCSELRTGPSTWLTCVGANGGAEAMIPLLADLARR